MTAHYKAPFGVIAAAITPIKRDYSIDLEAVPIFLDFLAKRGCHGALLMGTTGEGPSFGVNQRIELFRVALQVRQQHPDFILLAGTGTPNLEETVEMTKVAFDLGFNGVITLPPYYYRQASDGGLFAWFKEVIQRATPEGGAFMGYHIPAVSGVGLSLDLLARLKDAFPTRFAGLKNSSSDLDHAKALGSRFGKDLIVLTGHDRLFTPSLQFFASGCITASANLYSNELRKIWDAHIEGSVDNENQELLTYLREVMDRFNPASALIKSLLAIAHSFPRWTVRPPLLTMENDMEAKAVKELNTVRSSVQNSYK
jgi:4-hydroxy-tetrahydrodipicolinate synthase